MPPPQRTTQAIPVLRGVLELALPILAAWAVVAYAYPIVHPRDRMQVDLSRINELRPIRMVIKLPGTAERIPEPIFVYGEPGDAALAYVRIYSRARLKIGIEFWGVGAFESEYFPVPSQTARLEITAFLPPFFPREGDRAWGNVSPELQRIRSHEFTLAVDGIVRLHGPIEYAFPPRPVFYAGKNPFGGSLVSNVFTGTVLSARD